MNPQIDDGFRNVTFERCRELAWCEPVLRAAARRWLLTALVSCLCRALQFRMHRMSLGNAVADGEPEARR
jgi:hypothetical protein